MDWPRAGANTLYKDYFRFNALPFSIAPDPRFLYMSAQHRDALAHLIYGVQGEGGFVLLTGEVGTGKTTLCRCLLDQMDDGCEVAYILNPKLNAVEMLATVCDEFRIDVAPGATSSRVFVDALNTHLLRIHAQARRAVLIIDEAQNLDVQVLEQLRLLTNLETSSRKLLQIILIGQPELQEMLRRPQMRQVAQRIVARYHLKQLTRRETAAYVVHRLAAAGSLAPLFPRRVLRLVYRFTGGVPRLINLVCDRALLGTFSQGRLQVNAATLRKAAREVLGAPDSGRPWYTVRWQVAMLALLGAGGVLAGWFVSSPHWRAGKLPADSASAAAPIPAAVSPPRDEQQSVPVWPGKRESREMSERTAFRELFRRYGVDYDVADKRAPCRAAESAKLRCMAARGDLADLKRIGHPAVLRFDGREGGKPFYAVLVGLSSHTAALVLDGEISHLAVSVLAPQWSGHYLVLWKPPPGYRRELAEGSRGAVVKWLRRNLADVRGGKAEGGTLFDAELARRVREFQFAEGIEPDGIAGELTMTLLSARTNKALPRLGDGEIKG